MYNVYRGSIMSSIYTGRKIAIFSDVHGLLEPLEAVIQDVQKKGITEIFSLGDNIGCGPSPCEVIDMLECYDIKSVSGNAEEYCTLGIEPYINSFNKIKYMCHEWTYLELGSRRLTYIRCLPHSFDIEVGDKKIGLCHFANDVRTDYEFHGTEEYLKNIKYGNGYKQFLYTNTFEHKERIKYNIEKYGLNNPYNRGYVSARDYPIFDGKTVDYYDTIIQGHVHRNLCENGNGMEFYTIKAMALHFDNDPIDKAFYIILHEKRNNMGFDMEKVYVPYDREKMEYTINNSSEPTKKIKKMVRMI